MAQQTRDINQERQCFKMSENITTYGKRAGSRQVMHGGSVMLNCSNASLDADSYCLTDVFGQSAAIMGYSSYAPSKMAVRGLADTLRHEVSLSNCSIHFGRSFRATAWWKPLLTASAHLQLCPALDPFQWGFEWLAHATSNLS